MPLSLSKLLRPFEYFFKSQVAGGLVLIATTVVALLIANSPLAESFHHFWEFELAIGFDGFGIEQSLHHWINDGLMAIFFFVVGLELKREFLVGELHNPKKAMLPVAAALGGMLVPALIFFLFNPAGTASRGWGVPMATDIAFALGVIALLGDRISRSLAIFLTALAIVDDLGAVLVIALFYTGDLNLVALGISLLLLALLFVGNRLVFQHPNFYALVGFALWVALLKSGVHASVAGVLIGATIPIRPRYSHDEFLVHSELLLNRYRTLEVVEGPLHKEERLGTLLALEHICHDSMSPLQRMEHEMQGWVIFGVMPIFALANAGISLTLADLGQSLASPVTYGVASGLLLGKPLGILLFSWGAVRLGWCDLPHGSDWLDILGMGILAGIGFTMSMFITSLAFGPSMFASHAKVGIFVASLLAGVLGYLFLSLRPRKTVGQA